MSESNQRTAIQLKSHAYAVLTLTCVAMLSGRRSLNAIAQFGRDRGLEFPRKLDYDKGPDRLGVVH
jgi:hypothetical protein